MIILRIKEALNNLSIFEPHIKRLQNHKFGKRLKTVVTIILIDTPVTNTILFM